jgi:hypothetical protein
LIYKKYVICSPLVFLLRRLFFPLREEEPEGKKRTVVPLCSHPFKRMSSLPLQFPFVPILLKVWEQRGSSLKGKKNEDEGKKDRENRRGRIITLNYNE